MAAEQAQNDQRVQELGVTAWVGSGLIATAPHLNGAPMANVLALPNRQLCAYRFRKGGWMI